MGGLTRVGLVQQHKWIQDVKIIKLVYIRSLYNHFQGFYALSSMLVYIHAEGASCMLLVIHFENIHW